MININISLFFFLTRSPSGWTLQVNKAPSKLPESTNPHLPSIGVMAFYAWVLEIKPRSSYFDGKHFASWAISQVLILHSCQQWVRTLVFFHSLQYYLESILSIGCPLSVVLVPMLLITCSHLASCCLTVSLLLLHLRMQALQILWSQWGWAYHIHIHSA